MDTTIRDIPTHGHSAPCSAAPQRPIFAGMNSVNSQIEADTSIEDHFDDGGERDAKPAMLRGWKRKCPNCGNGPMMKSYLKVRDTCPVCDEELYHHKADDGPAYLTILIVGHIMAPTIIWAFVEYRPEPMVLATTFTIGCVALSLYLLPRLKGAIVGLQWAKRLYGFGPSS